MPNWREILNEIGQEQADHDSKSRASLDTVRRRYLGRLENYTGRNVIAYYSGFLSKPQVQQSDLNDEDKNGFMTAIHRLDRSKGLDLILHTPGGSISAAQSLVHYLRQMFGRDIRAVVPQLAMSAGTMLACSCKSIVMGKQSNLGPVDPQIRGIAAYGVIEEFERAYKEIKEDSGKILVWRPVLEQYHPTFLLRCENAIKWSNEFVKQQLLDVMFYKKKSKTKKVDAIMRNITDYAKGHDRHIHLDECEKMGLVVERLEDDPDLQDLVLSVHHCYMHTLMNSAVYKIIENHMGAALMKHVASGK